MQLKEVQKTDEELMELYLQGDEEAFNQIFTRHSGRVLAYLKKKTNASLAMDLLQETFLKLHRGRGLYNSNYPFLPWLFTIARNTLFDSLRKTRDVHEEILTDNFFQENKDETTDLSTQLSRLPLKQEEVIRLRYLQDWSFIEIAQKMNTSEVNVRQHVTRGLKNLRTLLTGRPS